MDTEARTSSLIYLHPYQHHQILQAKWWGPSTSEVTRDHPGGTRILEQDGGDVWSQAVASLILLYFCST